jgi:hypothetical protein
VTLNGVKLKRSRFDGFSRPLLHFLTACREALLAEKISEALIGSGFRPSWLLLLLRLFP